MRELQGDGVVAVVFGFTNGSWRTSMTHGSPAGVTVPVLDMQVDEVAQAIRSAVLGGATVSASFVAVPGMALQQDVDWLIPGETHTLGLVPLGSPSTGATWDPASFDIDRTKSGIQPDFVYSTTLTDACKGVSFHWDVAVHLLTATVPPTDSYTGNCNKTYLIRDTGGFQGIGFIRNVGAITRWWGNSTESGRGFFIEQKDSAIIMAGYIYDDAGNPTWFLATGTVTDNVFTAEMQTYRNGQTLTGPYAGPTLGPSLGTITVRFTSAAQGHGDVAGRHVSARPLYLRCRGTGGTREWLVVEQFGERSRILDRDTGQHARDGGLHVFRGRSADLVPHRGVMTTASTYTGGLQQYAMGQTVGGPYHAPQLVNGNVGTINVVFHGAKNATMTLPDGRQIAISRFAF